jgi:hypothetical protein
MNHSIHPSRGTRKTAARILAAACLILLLPVAGSQTAPPAAVSPGNATYHVDSTNGDDARSGRSPAQAWKSLDKVNAMIFAQGDRILFKAGARFAGRLHPQGSGSPKSPVKIDKYGEGGRPRIDAEGKFPEALLLENQEFWEVGNLEITNTGPTRETFRFGVRVRAWDFGTMRHIHLKNLYVHDVNGSLVKKDEGEGHGIVWENGGNRVKSRFDGLLIEGCHLLRTDRNGISGYTSYSSGRKDWFPSLRVVIRRNLLEDIGGDGIKPWGCDGALVEHNVVRRGRQRCDDYAAGIWPWNCDNTLIQFNEVSGMKGRKDGQAFDSDGFCANTVFQYNYSHDNDGGFMLICGRENSGTIIRYNISQNDRERLFHFYDLINDTRIYNNVFYTAKGIDLHLFLWTPGRSGWATDTHVYNNIFVIEGTGRNSYGIGKKKIDDGVWISKPGFGGTKNVVFRNNVLRGNYQDVPEEWKSLAFDPMLVAPGSGKEGFDSLAGYKLRDGSRCIRAGVPVENSGDRDFWGNKVPAEGNPSIGAHER